MANIAYWWAAEVEEVADRLIPKYHDHLGRTDVTVWYLFQDPPTKTAGRVVRGKARKIGGLGAHLVALARSRREPLGDGPLDFFVVTIAHGEWATMTLEAREALVDHELAHLWVDLPDDPNEDRKLALLDHDVEDFFEVVQRNGQHRPDAVKLAKVVAKSAEEQPSLFETP